VKKAVATVTLLACAVATASAIALISVEEEIEIGRQTQVEVRRRVPELHDAAVVNYVRGIGRRLAMRTTGARYPYSFTVANQREINAFALPGGPVWIHRGAIEAAANEAQLAGVLAHEIAHISQRHAAERITKELIANGLIGTMGALLGNDRSAQRAQLGARVLAGGYMLKFSRQDEREADHAGAVIVRRAGWDAREMVGFMEMLAREHAKKPRDVAAFLSSHPAPAERAARLRQSVRSGGVKDTAAFRNIKARLQKMPRAPDR
jgi:beta-barrel assembly-enhancing protease